MENYLLLKFIHLLGVVIFLRNITVTGWWKFMADRTGDSKIISFAQRQVPPVSGKMSCVLNFYNRRLWGGKK